MLLIPYHHPNAESDGDDDECDEDGEVKSWWRVFIHNVIR